MEVEEALRRLSSRGAQAEIIHVRAFSVDYSWEKGSQYGMTYSEEGYGLRVVVGWRQGFAYGPRLDEDLLSRALRAAEASEEDKFNAIPGPEGPVEPLPESFDPSLEEPRDAVRGMLDVVLSQSSGKFNLTMARAWGGWAEVRIANTEGVDVSARNSFAGVAAGGNYVSGDYVGPEVYEYQDSRSLRGLRPEAVVERLAGKVEMTRQRRKAEGLAGRPVLLTPKAVNMLLFPLLNHAVSLENVYRGRSPLRLGQDLGRKVTVADDPRVPGGAWSRAFDGEGLPARRTVVIDGGVFRTALSNTYWARRAGAPNTHSSWRTFMTLPAISATYLVFDVQPASDVGDAVVVDEVQGVHTSSFDTGEFSVSVSVAWDSEGGLREFVLSGSLTQLLRGLEGGAGPAERHGRVVTPALLVTGLRMA